MGLLLCRKQATRWRLRRPATYLAITQWEAMCGGHLKTNKQNKNKKTKSRHVQTTLEEKGDRWELCLHTDGDCIVWEQESFETGQDFSPYLNFQIQSQYRVNTQIKIDAIQGHTNTPWLWIAWLENEIGACRFFFSAVLIGCKGCCVRSAGAEERIIGLPANSNYRHWFFFLILPN